MKLKFSIKEGRKRIKLDFGKKVESKKRYLSELVKDKVILDLENAKKLLEKGDLIIYEVFNLWKFDEFAEKFFSKFNIMLDITLLKHGTFSLKKGGEAFCTYGHAHEKNVGEAYQVLKNDCFLLLSNSKNFNSYLIKLEEGCSFFIHPNFIHRLISGRKDCVVLNFVPSDAGHDYGVVKNKGFPFHVFYDENGKVHFKENENYCARLVLVEKVDKFDVLSFAEKEPEKLKKILRTPKDIYRLTKKYL
ncbi:MAG: glucose-6-phosphate isomerase family protein [Candidatus Aenigmatarchaeota archaeon]